VEDINNITDKTMDLISENLDQDSEDNLKEALRLEQGQDENVLLEKSDEMSDQKTDTPDKADVEFSSNMNEGNITDLYKEDSENVVNNNEGNQHNEDFKLEQDSGQSLAEIMPNIENREANVEIEGNFDSCVIPDTAESTNGSCTHEDDKETSDFHTENIDGHEVEATNVAADLIDFGEELIPASDSETVDDKDKDIVMENKFSDKIYDETNVQIIDTETTRENEHTLQPYISEMFVPVVDEICEVVESCEEIPVYCIDEPTTISETFIHSALEFESTQTSTFKAAVAEDVAIDGSDNMLMKILGSAPTKHQDNEEIQDTIPLEPDKSYAMAIESAITEEAVEAEIEADIVLDIAMGVEIMDTQPTSLGEVTEEMLLETRSPASPAAYDLFKDFFDSRKTSESDDVTSCGSQNLEIVEFHELPQEGVETNLDDMDFQMPDENQKLQQQEVETKLVDMDFQRLDEKQEQIDCSGNLKLTVSNHVKDTDIETYQSPESDGSLIINAAMSEDEDFHRIMSRPNDSDLEVMNSLDLVPGSDIEDSYLSLGDFANLDLTDDKGISLLVWSCICLKIFI